MAAPPSSNSARDDEGRALREARQQRQRDEARRAILDATEAVLVEDGPDGLSMRNVASRCGYAAPTLYHYFGDKTGLIDAVLDERFSRLFARLQDVAKGDDPAAYLAELARAFVRFGEDNPSHYHLLTVRSPGDRPPPPNAERARDLMEAPILQLEEAGRLRESNCEVVLQTLWALCHGLISLTTSRPDYEWSEGLVDHAIDSLLNGILQQPGTRRARPRGETK